MHETLYILVGFPLLVIAVTILGWWEHHSGSSLSGRGELEYLLAIKHSVGFARSAARSKSHRWQSAAFDAIDVASTSLLESLLRAKRRLLDFDDREKN